MTDKEKLDAIRAEIHRLVDVRGYDREMANDLFTFIDSLPNEPVSEDLEEAAEEWDESLYRSDAFKAGANWQKTKDESTTEDLGEYINELSKQFPEVSFAKLSRIAVRVAKWQKEQMMAKAIDGTARPDDNEIWCNLTSNNLEDGDKVKVIVIKKD